jgi:hypothetical protein
LVLLVLRRVGTEYLKDCLPDVLLSGISALIVKSDLISFQSFNLVDSPSEFDYASVDLL